MKPCFNLLFLVSLLIFLLPALISAQQGKIDFNQLEKVILQELKETNTPGAAIGIVKGDSVLFSKGFGVSSIETGIPIRPDYLFRIGSITKLFTALLLVTLAEEGKIELNESIGKYVKELSPELSQVTSHQLLSHTAGMTDESPSDYGFHDEQALSSYVRSLKKDHFFDEPGRLFSYSNPGFDVIGFIIQQLEGKLYADLMNERLFKPLGMSSSTFRPTMAMTYPLAQGHNETTEKKLNIIRPFGDNVEGWPDGFMFSNLNDLVRFAIAFMDSGKIDGKQVLRPSAIVKLSTPRVDLQSPFGFGDGKYGYGVFIHDYRGIRIIWHAGIIPGYGSLLLMVPAYRFAVIALANKSGVTLNNTCEKAMELLLPLNRKSEIKKKPLVIGRAEINKYVGIYVNKPDRIEIVENEGRLLLKREESEFPIIKVGQDRFSIVKSAGPGEEFVLLSTDDGGLYLHFERHAFKKVVIKK